jgi:transformation/transcription domain-associated protein
VVLDIRQKGTVATELRDAIEAWSQGPTYKPFLDTFVPIFLKILDGQPVFLSNSPEQRLRSCVLEILHRLPSSPSETIKPYAKTIVSALMNLVQVENEDNAVLCMKTIMDLLRHNTETLKEHAQPFLDLIKVMFESMENAVKDSFDNPTQNTAPPVPSTPNSNAQYSQSPRPGSPTASISSMSSEVPDQQQNRQLLRGMQSFKVLAECPIIVVSLFQAYRNIVHQNVKAFVPLIKHVLLLQAKPQEKAHTEAKAQGKSWTGVSPQIKNRAAFGDFITAQVKTMSFLAYLLRVYSNQLTDFIPTLPHIVVRLLKDCPREKSGARKELLVAIRHIINFNFRKIFLIKIDELLDERTLIGDGLTVYETMRPLAYSMLADLIHHLRDSLSKEQIRRTVEVYTKNLHDTFPGTSFQTMSAKLLLNMAECIAKLEPKQDARYFLIMILNAIGDKFAAMNRQFSNAVKLSKQYSQPSIDAVPENHMAEKENPPDWDDIDIFNAAPIKTSNPKERSTDPIADNKFLFKNLLHGLKNLFYQLRTCNPPRVKEEIDTAQVPPNWNEVSFGYCAEEVEVLIKLFREGAQVFRYYGVDKSEAKNLSPSELLANQHMVSSDKEEKELLESFATVFHYIDPATFHEIFHSEIPRLYEMMFEHSALIHIPQFLLASEATSPSFCGMLLQFLMERLEDIGTADVTKSSILLRLFKLSFMAVTLFHHQNEPVLLPHVSKIIIKSIELSKTAEEPTNYFLLLRSLFRSIGGGRFEHLYKEILPLLEMLLDVLNNLLLAASKPQERDLFVELSLTVPARLSNLLPHLSYLMRPLVVALGAGSDLVGQGLRTLELCVDNLTAEYLDPIMAPVIDEIMAALWEHLQPNPYSHFHAHTTMRILGKLGGRNRKFLIEPPTVSFKPYTDDESSYDIRLIGSNKDRAFPLAIGIDVAIAKLMETPKAAAAKKADGFHKHQAFRLISAQTKLLMGYDQLPEDFAQLVRLQANDLIEKKCDVGEDLMMLSERDKSLAKKQVEQIKLKKLLKACMFARTVPELKSDAGALLQDICRHFCLLELGCALAELKHASKPFDPRSGEGPVYLDNQVICDAIVESLASDNEDVRQTAEQCILDMRDASQAIFGSAEKVSYCPMLKRLSKTFSHNCYSEEWFMKAGAALGIEILTKKAALSEKWISERQIELIKALSFVIKDMPQDLTAKARLRAQELMVHIIRQCNKNVSADDMKQTGSPLYRMCSSMVADLAHINKHVRYATQQVFKVLAEATGIPIHELINPVKGGLVMTIWNKPLRALPFPIQIAYIDAITFCLKLQHNVLEFNDQLNRMLMEALALADADDEALAPNKPSEHRNAEAIVQLRVACIRLLSTAQTNPEFHTTPPNNTFLRIIAVFFKTLYSKNQEVIEAANAGLHGILQTQSKLPKDVLQSGLRPILVNLQDPRKLSVEGLDGLARLLKLLTNYFKVEIGSRLLDHLKIIADPALLQKVSFMLIEQNRSMKVVTSIFNVFHLLPPAAISFLDQLVKKIVDLETSLRRTRYSPFREPLILYLCQYPEESWKYFAPLMKDKIFGRFFAQLLAEPTSEKLREKVINDPASFLKSFTLADDATDEQRYIAGINAIHVAWSICQHEQAGPWLTSNEELRKKLFELAKTLQTKLKQNVMEPTLRLAVEQAGEQVIQVLITYLNAAPNDIDFFFEVVDAITASDLKPLPSFFNFIYSRMVSSESIDYWRTLVMKCIELYTAKNTTQGTKTFVFHYIVIPIFAMDVKRNWDNLFGPAKGTKLMDRTMTETIHNRLWKPHALADAHEETEQLGVDHSRMELLQLTTFMVKYHHNLIQDARKVVIKFAWSYIRLEDIINKQAAYVLIAFFIAVYDTPPKIASQVYNSLLKAHQNEGRTLVMQGLELLAPVLRKRIGVGDGKAIPMWARIPKKILAEDSSNLQQLLSIFGFLVRHPDLFYEAREPLSQIIIPAINKVAQPPNPSNESKKMALNLASLILNWEQRAAQEAVSSTDYPLSSPQGIKRRADGSPVVHTHVANSSMRIILIKYLVSFISYLPERYPVPSLRAGDIPNIPQPSHVLQSTEVCKKAVQLLQDFLSSEIWGDLDLEPVITRKLEDILIVDRRTDEKAEKNDKGDSGTTRIVNTLQILKIIVNVKDDEWVQDRIATFQKMLEKPLRYEDADIQSALNSDEVMADGDKKLTSLLGRLLQTLPEPVQDEEGAQDDSPSSEFVTLLGTIATEALANNNYVSAANILWSLCKRRPDEIDQHLPQVMKTFSNLIKEHYNAALTIQIHTNTLPQNMRPDPAQSQQLDPNEVEIQTGVVVKMIDILAARIGQLGDQRRPYLSALASLTERSQSHAVCMKILDLVEYWVFESTELVPTLKEKTAVLTKMLLFENKLDQTLQDRFLDMVIRIYEDQKITRSELTVRMEHAFLIGTRAKDVEMRNRFMTIFDRSLSRTASSRISYVLASQHWDTLSETYWLSQVIQLLFGSVEMNSSTHLHPEDLTVLPPSRVFGTYSKDSRISDVMVDEKLESVVASQKRFCMQLGDCRVRELFEPLMHLQHTDPNLAHDIWVSFFPLCWSALNKDDQADLEKGILALLTKEFHTRSIDKRPNCVQTMLEAIVKTKPRIKFPPHIMKFLARQYNAWYTSATYMEDLAIAPIIDTAVTRESNLDALLEVYAGLQEDDLFYGTWRRRCQFVESNAALSYEQSGVWDKAQGLYEAAQIKARTGALPFSTGEYMLWEDHWVLCAQKLQQWEILSEFAKHENFNDLYLEATWRNFDAWNTPEAREGLDGLIKGVSDAPTPRRTFFQAFMSLLKFHNKQESVQDFNRVCDEAIQLSIRKWHQLPKRITNAHVPILQHFQQFVELHDASLICASLHSTTATNLDMKSQELKLLLQTWRDRLPNFWDDINAWQDLVTWRQHIFQLINGTYLHLLPPQQGNASGNSFAYRGYHETAWIINRFAHVARKHNLPEVCINQLGRIYTLPNIEIQEAFLKLREQAKCHYQNRSELNSGLDVINNTNLNYFTQQQKAEFYTLKGMFLDQLGQKNEANEAYGTALYFDLKLPKAWAEWGRYNDLIFKEDPQNLEKAAAAISCYLEASSLYKNHKSRKLLGRILWLLSLDNAEHLLVSTFDQFKGETPVWYWITYIPQLLLGLARPEASVCRAILGKLAKTYPQALYCQLRMQREEYAGQKKIEEDRERAKAKQQGQSGGQTSPPQQGSPERPSTSHSGSGQRPSTANGETAQNNASTPQANGEKKEPTGAANTNPAPDTPKKSWDHTDEISSILKTAFPLLALSLETMLDSISKNFRCPPDEDAYRLIVALLNDGLTYVGRQPALYAQEQKLPSSTESNIQRFASSILPAHIRKAFEAEFVQVKPTMFEYIQKLRKWRNRFEEKLDHRQPTRNLESYSAQLSEFRFLKFDDVEVPGQYLLQRDKNQDFVRIERFLPDVDLVRGTGQCHRRLKIRGHDGSIHPFAVQYPAQRTSRREERMLQLFRIFNGILAKRKESRRRNLQFHLPLIIPVTVQSRLIQDDAAYVNMLAIFEDYCRRNGIDRDEPILFNIEKMRALSTLIQPPPANHPQQEMLRAQNMERSATIRHETFVAIQEKFVPPSLMLDYFKASYSTFDDFWLFRKSFSYQLAAHTFMTYVMYVSQRQPSRITISRATGKIWGNELVPSVLQPKPLFHNSEAVHFRLTPSMQVFMGPLFTEGIFAPSIMAIARCLTEPEGELDMILSVFIRDEMLQWAQGARKNLNENGLRESVQVNSDMVVKRATSLAKAPEAGNLPANQTVVDAISSAVDPRKLSLMDPLWMAYL